jgi:hypothetical protein
MPPSPAPTHPDVTTTVHIPAKTNLTDSEITEFIEAIIAQSGVNETRLTITVVNGTKSTDFVVGISAATGDDTKSAVVASNLKQAVNSGTSIIANTNLLLAPSASSSQRSITTEPGFLAGVIIGAVVAAILLAILVLMCVRAQRSRSKSIAAVEL